jgi:tetratricopeptide (TPR) repeat protein
MAIKGSLTEATLSDVIQLLSFSLKSGCLSVTDGKNFGNIFIKDGKIIYATLLNRKMRLGDVLLAKKLIDQAALDQALTTQKKNKRRLGEILIENGAVTSELIARELRELVNETIFTMLTWDSGYFNFEADLLPGSDEFTVQLSPQEILLDGARRIDEWHKIEHKIPPFETVLQIKEDVSKIPLTDQEKRIIGLIDGARTIDDILKLSEFDFFETCRIIYGLLSAGLLEKPEKFVTAKKITGNITEYKNLGFAFYKTEMFDEAEREYKKVLEIEPRDSEALLYLGLIAFRRGALEEAKDMLLKAREIEKRPSVLVNLGFLFNKLKLHQEAVRYLSEARELSPDDPKVNCNLGIAHYKLGDYESAEPYFDTLVVKNPDLITAYYYLSAVNLKKGNLERAVGLLKEAIDKFPRLGSLKNNLALIYESMDRPEEAERLYRQAVEENPQDPLLIRNLADFYYETQILGAAKELYEKIPENNKNWEVLFKLGNILLRQGDVDTALAYWEQARQLNPREEIIGKNIEILQKARGR